MDSDKPADQGLQLETARCHLSETRVTKSACAFGGKPPFRTRASVDTLFREALLVSPHSSETKQPSNQERLEERETKENSKGTQKMQDNDTENRKTHKYSKRAMDRGQGKGRNMTTRKKKEKKRE